MEQNVNQQEALQKAKKRVNDLKGFYNHLMVFIVIHALILAAVLYFDGNLKFFITFSVLGWGIGLFIHALVVFKWNPFTGKDWEQRKLKEFLEEQENR
ncbi:MAG: 2TM domain-containing protein [Nonlabens sp.]|uniref:2TM domain-containing protein n=1 Tax=Nonlabens sp. TaxID=1888209 RepID=UPI003EF820E5